jgi:fructuronate reductase
MKNQLCNDTISNLGDNVQLPGYDRSKLEVGIVHLGPGAFHRAHQAVYTDDLLRLNYKNWGICAVSLNSARFRDNVKKQDNLYTLAIRDIDPKLRIIGSIIDVLFAPESPEAVISRLSESNVKVVTLTITEKGYCLSPNNRLDFENSDIKFDLEHPDSPKTAIGYLSAGLRKRYRENLDPFVLVSCDNLMDNGVVLKQAVVDFSSEIDQDLASWISYSVFSPRTMVDSITPTTNQALIKSVENDLGFVDKWPVQRESFSQWIFEDVPGMVLPPWDSVGAIFGADVKKYESCKLKILNGLHSSIAFVGLISGFETVAEALENKPISDYVQKLLDLEIIPSLAAPEGLDVQTYSTAILQRFKNTQIHHFLSQIAWDSSKKIPVRI